MNIIELNNLLLQGENSKIEFKQEITNNDSFAKEIVALTNTYGGIIFIGINDKANIIGINDLKTEEKIINICRNNIVPSIIPEIEQIIIEDKKIIKIMLEKGKNKHYKVKSTNKFYIRAGSISIEASNEELIRLFQQGEQYHFEVTSLPQILIKDIEILRFKICGKEIRNIEIDDNENLENYLYNLQLKNSDNYINIAGLLLFGKEPYRYLPQSGIDLVCFSGETVLSNIINNREENGVITECIEKAEDFVRYNTKKYSKFNETETRRIDICEYEPFVINLSSMNYIIFYKNNSLFI